MKAKQSVIMIEFNELSPSLMFRFLGEGKLPNFQKLYQESQAYLTEADAQPPTLNPWVQWVSVHAGVPYSEHGIRVLGEGHKLRQKCIWDVVSAAGGRVWVCGSMNSHYDVPLNGYFLPDPWTSAFPPTPDSLQPYFRFVQQHVLEHTNERVPLSKADYLKFLSFMVKNGLSAETVGSIVQQLSSESGKRNRWKRAMILDRLQFDLFRSCYRKLTPQFSTFFSNSTAHFQHSYWRNLEPDLFKVAPSSKEQKEFENAILFGYQQMDKLIAGFLELADAETTLIFCTALSQQPCLIYEEQGGKTFYRPHKFENLLDFAGVSVPYEVSPVMAEQFHLIFETESAAQNAELRLRALEVDGRAAIFARRNEAALYCGCAIFNRLPEDAVLHTGGAGRSAPFFNMFYHVEDTKSGMHHSDGLLWIRRPDRKSKVHSEKVPLMAIAPTALEVLGMPRPEHMRGLSLLHDQAEPALQPARP
ncbi:MAG: hypothetical protein ACRD2Q_03255 [Terriglobales bacterium]